jgi:hypothetical protein
MFVSRLSDDRRSRTRAGSSVFGFSIGLHQSSLIVTHRDALSDLPDGVLRVLFPARSGRRERSTMGRHRLRIRSCRAGWKHDQDGSLSLSFVITIKIATWRQFLAGC